jgi:hypothetical protein
MTFASRRLPAILPFCAAAVLAMAGCTGQPSTTEKTPPKMVLNIVDLSNSANNIQNIAPMTKVAAGAPDNGANPDPSGNTNYKYLFSIVASDPGGVQSFGYTSLFNSGGPCNPNSNYAAGSSTNVPPQTSQTNPDGTVPTQLLGIINVTAAQEKQIICNVFPGGDIPGVYVITATATNYSNKTRKALWYVNIGPVTSVPTPTKGG